jgi:hypothetical protein
VCAHSPKFIQAALLTFQGVKSLDKKNEAIPTADKAMQARAYRRRQTLDDITPLTE